MSFWDKIGHWADEALGFQGRRKAERQVNDQIKAYKEQTELTKKQLKDTRNEQAAEKRKINEKQIRSLRRNYRSPGILGIGQPASQDTASTLGG